jgi:predicted short-subunit dehydrogenase-like oxidoreductase (DUF2520 family)
LPDRNEIIGIIGAGRVGSALARLFCKEGQLISTVVDSDIEKARLCLKDCDGGMSASDIEELNPETTVLFISVPDDKIVEVGRVLIASDVLRPGMVIAHTSGFQPADVLQPVRREEVSVCSFHPCFSFTDDFQGDLEGVHIALEGDAEGCRRLSKLAESIGGKPFLLSKEKKPLYHVACTMASNYVVALMHLVQTALRGSDGDEGFHRMLPLVRGTIENIERAGVERALTGPILRGDAWTVQKHLGALLELDSGLVSPYVALGRVTLRIAEERGLEPEKIRSIEEVLLRFGSIE